MKPFYKIMASATKDDTADLSIFDVIELGSASAFVADLKKIDAKKIDITISSPGGSVFDAVAIHNALRMSGKTITTRVLGIAASAAAYIFLAGDKRVMPENTMQMVHNASMLSYGNAKELAEDAETLKKIDATIHAAYVKRTGQSAAKIAELLDKDTWLDAPDCLKLGLCDEVAPVVKATASFDTSKLPTAVAQRVFAAKPVTVAGIWDSINRQAAETKALYGGR